MHDALGPSTTPADPPPTVAVRTSVSLAVLGIAASAAAVAFFVMEPEAERAGPGALLMMGGLISFLVGGSVIFAAPRGRRRWGILANAIPLGLWLLICVIGALVP